MKYCRYGIRGQEKPALVDDYGVIRDLSEHIQDLAGDMLAPNRLAELADINFDKLPAIDPDVRLGPPVSHVGKFIGIGLNYADHAAESGMDIPSEPVLFMKATSSICGPYDSLVLPYGSKKTDWEVELGVIIGRHAKFVLETDAMAYVAGYCIVHDVSERSFQLDHEGQWTKGKSADTFGPIGPWLVTKDEVPDPQSLNLWLSVNGKQMQNGSTRTMVFSVAFLVHYISQFMSLQPGDIITTGTPPGVGMGKNPPQYLKVGDVVKLGVDGLGQQQQVVTAGSRK
ncbi:MAG: fumarylacetoacetate hydrolase family protein [Aestuariivita sp.]|nr:fumarylacetoacetate hydrolase family protein [Aestuariivita sp.]